jgi:hypothetical protein
MKVKKENPDIRLIDSSTGIQETLQYSEEQHHDHGHGHEHADTGHQAEEHQHGHHGEHPFEWAGAFKLDPGVYKWSFAKVDGKYADPAMKMIYVASEPKDPIEHVEEKAVDVFEQKGRPLKHGGRLRSGELHLLQFDDTRNTTEFEIKIDKTLSKESGIPVAMLDPAATGPENAPLAYYETVMRQNMKTLESTLGVK